MTGEQVAVEPHFRRGRARACAPVEDRDRAVGERFNPLRSPTRPTLASAQGGQ